MPDPQPISPELDALTCELIGYCLDILATREDLWPQLAYLEEGSDEPVLVSFSDDSPDECLEAACTTLREQPGAYAYALAYSGFVELDEGAQDALLVEFGEKGAPSAYSAYVAYRHTRDGEFFCADPLPAGEEELLL